MADVTISLLKSLRYHFTVDEDASNDKFAVIRTNFQNAEEVGKFVKQIEIDTNTNFSTKISPRQNVKRMLYRKQWICKNSSFRKRPNSKKNAACKAFIDAKIKKMNRNTKKNDNFLKLKEPLPCVIKINLDHSHSQDNTEILKRLAVIPKVRKEYEGYFYRGFGVCEARRFHERKLVAQYGFNILVNSAFNPTTRQVYHLYDKWRSRKTDEICDSLKQENEGNPASDLDISDTNKSTSSDLDRCHSNQNKPNYSTQCSDISGNSNGNLNLSLVKVEDEFESMETQSTSSDLDIPCTNQNKPSDSSQGNFDTSYNSSRNFKLPLIKTEDVNKGSEIQTTTHFSDKSDSACKCVIAPRNSCGNQEKSSGNLLFDKGTSNLVEKRADKQIKLCSPEKVAMKYCWKRMQRVEDSDGFLSLIKGLLPDIKKLPDRKRKLLKTKIVNFVKELSEAP